MNNSQITLDRFFSLDKELLRQQLFGVESGEKMSLLKGTVLKSTRIKWPLAFDNIIDKIGDVLNVSIPDIMVMSWNKYRILLKYLDREKYPATETFLVALTEHTIKSEHRPFIEILISDKPVGKIEFNITVFLMLEGVILKIQDGKIKEIRIGTCKGKGTMSCENQIIFRKETEKISFPVLIGLGEGVPIMPLNPSDFT